MFFGVNEKVHANEEGKERERDVIKKQINLNGKKKQHDICIVCEKETAREIRAGKR